MPKIEFLHFPGCPHAEDALRLTRDVVDRLIPGTGILITKAGTDLEARSLNFPGSPSILIDGIDIEGRNTGTAGLCCRIYNGATGVPPEWMIEAGILRALHLKHILFLCVANSARSQMAEGIARSLAPKGVRISSAGSLPSNVRPQAIQVMKEIGIDMADQRSKGIDSIDSSTVDAVITLCAEEVCPVFPGKVARIHWGLPDPVISAGDGNDAPDAFRHVRDELQSRLKLLFLDRRGR